MKKTNKITIVEITRPGNYRSPGVKRFGVLLKRMTDTAIVNFHNNIGGLCVNIAHGDYRVVPVTDWVIVGGEVVVLKCDGQNYYTGLEIL